MKLYIKYMVSNCCKLMVKEKLSALGLTIKNVGLGEVEIDGDVDVTQLSAIQKTLHKMGLELMIDNKLIQIERIKTAIIDMVHYSNEAPEKTYSAYISEKLEGDYPYMANLFSETTGYTIQQFIIIQKIERAKELITYNELSLSAIATKLHYSSLGHFSNQFKKVTGLTPSFFKALKTKKRLALDELLKNSTKN